MNRQTLLLFSLSRPLWIAAISAFFFQCPMAEGQEAIRNVDQPGEFPKYLTPGMVDRWIFNGKEDETIIVRAKTKEFDATLELVQVINEVEQSLIKIDDEGSNAGFKYRLPADGKYKVLVHGFETKGGGNYVFSLQQYKTTKVELGVPIAGTFENGRVAWFRFLAQKDTFATISSQDISFDNWQVLDPLGNEVHPWERMFGFEKDGEYLLRLTGDPDSRYECTLATCDQKQLNDNSETEAVLRPDSGLIFNLAGRKNEFRLIEIERDGELDARLIPAMSTKPNLDLLPKLEKPEIHFISDVPSKGRFERYAVVWGADAVFQLHLQTRRGVTAKIKFRDPIKPIDTGASIQDRIAIGDQRFFGMEVKQGEAIRFSVKSREFDAQMKLYNAEGKLLAADDDGGGGFDSKLRYIAYKPTKLWIAVSAVGFGGGGVFDFISQVEESKALAIGTNISGELQRGEEGYFSFEGTEGQKVLIQLESQLLRNSVTLINDAGVSTAESASTQNGDALLSHKFAKSGKYSLMIRLSDQGKYQLRAFLVN